MANAETETDKLGSTTSLTPSLTQRLRRRTSELHHAAEASGIVAKLMQGQITRSRYALFLRNLLPAYQAMEAALQHNRGRPIFAGLAQPSLYRADRIVTDLAHLEGSGWAGSLPLLASGRLYADRIAWVGQSELLIAHCYTRYLGDLNGGRVLMQRVLRRFGPDFPAVAFITFPDIQDMDGFCAAYRRNLDGTGRYLSDASGVVEEAAIAFQLNIEVSHAVSNWCGPD
jgi:heme oxygenase